LNYPVSEDCIIMGATQTQKTDPGINKTLGVSPAYFRKNGNGNFAESTLSAESEI